MLGTWEEPPADEAGQGSMGREQKRRRLPEEEGLALHSRGWALSHRSKSSSCPAGAAWQLGEAVGLTGPPMELLPVPQVMDTAPTTGAVAGGHAHITDAWLPPPTPGLVPALQPIHIDLFAPAAVLGRLLVPDLATHPLQQPLLSLQQSLLSLAVPPAPRQAARLDPGPCSH